VFRAGRHQSDAGDRQALLARGFHIVIPPLTAQPGPVMNMDTAYKLMTDHGFSKSPVMEGTGRPAGEACAWAIQNPGQGGLHSTAEISSPQPHDENIIARQFERS